MYFGNRSELRVTTSPMKLGSLVTNLCQSGLVFMKHMQVLKLLSHCRDKSYFFLLQEMSIYLFQLEVERRVHIRRRQHLKEMKNPDPF